MLELHQEIRYCTSSDGARIAYASMGEGPPLVKTPNWFGIEFELEAPTWRPLLVEPARHHRLIRFDQRGCGLSEREVATISVDAWVNDLEAVVDAAGIERFPLFGVSQGGPIAIEYAFRHPERVSQIVLLGSMVTGNLRRGQADVGSQFQAVVSLIRQGWEEDNPAYRNIMTSLSLPDGTNEERDALTALSRKSTTGATAALILAAIGNIDVTARLAGIAVPTLIFHALDDQLVPFSQAQILATLIPNARLVALQSKNHTPLAREPAWQVFLSEMAAFLAPQAESELPGPLLKGTGSTDLSHREIEVLRLVAAGRSNQQIADDLVISINTVRRHVSNVFDKIGVVNRTEAANYTREHSL